MDIKNWLQETSVLYEYMPVEVQTLIESVVVFHSFRDADGDATELVQLLCSMAVSEAVNQEELVRLAVIAPYLSPIAFFLPKPSSVNTVFLGIANIITSLNDEVQ